jgi:hypothetical protein
MGPHAGPPPGDPAFWNAPFGAVRSIDQIGTAADAAAFFRDGLCARRAVQAFLTAGAGGPGHPASAVTDSGLPRLHQQRLTRTRRRRDHPWPTNTTCW